MDTESLQVQEFYCKDDYYFIDNDKQSKKHTQLSDHFGLSVDLYLEEP